MENIEQRTMSITRVFDASVSLVWQALTKAELIKEWWGPEGFTNTIHKMDVRVGGKWLFTMHSPDGTEFENDHTYLELIENEKLVLQNNGPQNFEIIIRLFDRGNQTEVKWEVIFDSVPTMSQAINSFKADIGMEQNMERFNQCVNQLK